MGDGGKDSGTEDWAVPTAFCARMSARYCRWYSWRKAHAEKGVKCGAAMGAKHWRK